METTRTFPARTVRVKDGDTFVLTVDRGDNDTSQWTARLRGVDAPDKGDLKLQATELARKLLNPPLSADPLKSFWLNVVLRQMPDGSLEREKYGRFLLSVVLPDGTILAEQLLAAGLAKPWDGQGPHPWLLNQTPLMIHVNTTVHLTDQEPKPYIPLLFRD